MTKAEKRALRPFLARLRRAFEASKARLGSPGHSRTWADPYFAAVLKCARRLRKARLNSARLGDALSGKKRGLLAELVKRTTDRDRNTVHRWSKGLALAWDRKVTSGDLASWLKDGGGISGRATEATGKV